MTELLKGKPVAERLTKTTSERAEKLRNAGIAPTLAVVRLGENPEDMAYEKGLIKRAGESGISVLQFVFKRDITQEQLKKEMIKINLTQEIHGILLFRPLPDHIDEKAICEIIAPEKDVDGITSSSMAGVFTGSGKGYSPCTAEACIEMLDHYGYELKGKRVTVFGRSLVIGKPAAMLVMGRHATVTVCHSRTRKEDLRNAGRNAEIIIAAVGRSRMIDEDCVGSGQIILDVGTNSDENGKLCGDVDFDKVSEKAAAITPVPGGVGSVTTAVLMKHVVEAAEHINLKQV